jgi:hypothetical protein
MRLRAMHGLKVVLAIVAAAAMGGAVMVLWNLVVPDLFAGSRAIDFWHALGLLVLCRILFGGFRGRGGWHGHHQRQRWQRWQAMTAEEREQFRQQRRDGPCRPHAGEA